MRISSTVSLFAAIAALSTGAVQAQEQARSADGFVETIGVCTHFQYNGVYTNTFGDGQTLQDRLVELGVRHIRDGANQYDYVHNIYYALYSRAGIRFTLNCVPFSDWPVSSTITRLKVHPEIVEGIEDPNEPDNSVWNYNGLSGYPADKAYATDLYNAVKADSSLSQISVLAFGMAGIGPVNSQLGPVPFELENMHPYAGGNEPGRDLDGKWTDYADQQNYIFGRPTQPIVITECGWSTATGSSQGVSEKAQGKYFPRVFAEHFNRTRIVRTHTYDAADDGTDINNYENGLGLVRADGSRKPAFTAEKNMISLLQESSWNASGKYWNRPSFSPGKLNYSFSASTGDVHHALLQKSNGDFYLMLWRNALSYDRSAHADIANGDALVTITLGQSISRVSQYRYDDSGNLNSSGLSINGNQIVVGVPDSVLFVKLTPSAGPPLNTRLGIRAYNGRYVSVVTSDASHLQAAFAGSVGTWESFKFVDAGSGQVALYSNLTGKYVTCDLNESEHRLRADWASNIDNWEKFVVVDRGGGSFSLWSPVAGRYVSADLNQSSGVLRTDWATGIGTWETFNWTPTVY